MLNKNVISAIVARNLFSKNVSGLLFNYLIYTYIIFLKY